MELLHCTTDDGIRLDGLWSPAQGDNQLSFDAVIMLHGVTANFYSTDFFNAAVDPLVDAGVAVLRVNNRGHDVVNRAMTPDGVSFIGASFEKIADAALDCRAWIDLARKRGADRVALWGHSLGAVKALLYGKEEDPRVACTVATSPPRFSYEAFRKDPVEWPIFEGHFREAEALVTAGKPDTLIRVTKPTNLIISAATFVEKYGPQGGFDYMDVAETTTSPLLFTMGGLEGVEARPGFSRISLLGSDTYLRELTERNPMVHYAQIDGADHWYSGCEAALNEAVGGYFDTVAA